MRRKAPVPFGKGPTEKDPNHGHLAGGLLHLGRGAGNGVKATALLPTSQAGVAGQQLDSGDRAADDARPVGAKHHARVALAQGAAERSRDDDAVHVVGGRRAAAGSVVRMAVDLRLCPTGRHSVVLLLGARRAVHARRHPRRVDARCHDRAARRALADPPGSVSYTHLTLPTKRIV